MIRTAHPDDSTTTKVCIFCKAKTVRTYDGRPANSALRRRLMFPALGVPLTHRRKQCRTCGERWQTLEVPLTLLENPDGQLSESLTQFLYTVLRANRSKLRSLFGTQNRS